MSRPITGNSSLYIQKLQEDGVLQTELIDFTLPNGRAFRWTTSNGRINYTLSGALTTYSPFPGKGGGIEETMDLGVSVVDFVIANYDDDIRAQVISNDFALARLQIGRVFTDTPDLGRMELYNGKVGDFSSDRHEIKGKARNYWKSINVQWPYFTYGDRCQWRFGSTGCGFNTASVTIAVTSINVGSSTVRIIRAASGMLSGNGANHFQNGRCTITAGANSGMIRNIIASIGDEITLANDLPYTDMRSTQFNVYPGCNKRLLIDCKSRYNNEKNYLAWNWMPRQTDVY